IATFGIGRAFLDLLLLFTVPLVRREGFLSVLLPVGVDLFFEQRLVGACFLADYFLRELQLVCAGLDVGGVDKHVLRPEQATVSYLFQDAVKDLLEQISVLEASFVVLSESRKMRHFIIEAEAEEPSVRQVSVDFLNGPAHRTNAKGV